MNIRKLSLILIWGGLAVLALAGVWFMQAYSSVMDTVGTFGGREYASKFVACLYSSPAICQGASFLSDGPGYSPVIFWIGAIALLVGVVLRFTANQPSPGGADAAVAGGGEGTAPAEGHLMGIIPPQRYVTITYIVALVSVLLGPPVVVVTFVLCLLGLFVFRPRLSELDGSHLGAICAVSGAVLLLLFIVPRGSLWVLLMLAQLALYYIGFNSYRNGRTIGLDNLNEEARLAFKPIVERFSGSAKS